MWSLILSFPMKAFVFSNPASLRRTGTTEKRLLDVLSLVSENTDTHDLVVALYIIPGAHRHRGTAYAREWMTPKGFITRRGHWSITSRWDIPDDLPSRYKLIRMRLDGDRRKYPRVERDRYGWEFRYANFTDHLAALFAHELHHFRRYHLGLHPRKGEHSANRWALEHTHNLGFDVEAKRLPIQRRKRTSASRILKKFPRIDPYSAFRKLQAGTRLTVTHDPHRRYLGQTVTVVRPIRSNSKRIVVETSDGKTWRWPISWLKLTDDKE